MIFVLNDNRKIKNKLFENEISSIFTSTSLVHCTTPSVVSCIGFTLISIKPVDKKENHTFCNVTLLFYHATATIVSSSTMLYKCTYIFHKHACIRESH